MMLTILTIWSLVKPVVEVFVLWFVFYQILVFFEGTRAFQVLKGLIYLLIGFLISQLLGLTTLNWLLKKLFCNINYRYFNYLSARASSRTRTTRPTASL